VNYETKPFFLLIPTEVKRLSHFGAKPSAVVGRDWGRGWIAIAKGLANFTLAFEWERFRGVDVEVVEEMEERNRKGR
jgi:hypothetical protein